MRTIYSPRGTYASTRRNAANPAADLYVPSLQVEIYGQSGAFGTGRSFDPTRDVLEVHTSKDLSQPLGTATLTLKAHVTDSGSAFTTWLDLLHPMDFLVIRASKTGDRLVTLFAGYITSITESMQVSTPGQERHAVTVQAADLMLGLTSPKLAVPSSGSQMPKDQNGRPAVKQWATLFKALMDTYFGSVEDNVPNWMLNYLSSVLHVEVPKGATIDPSALIALLVKYLTPALFNPQIKVGSGRGATTYGYLDLVNFAFSTMPDFVVTNFQVSPFDGAIFNVIQSLVNAPFYEFFGDIRSGDQIWDLGLPDRAIIGSAAKLPSTELLKGAHASARVNRPGFLSGQDQAAFYLVLRKTPFGSDLWPKLGAYRLLPEDLFAYDLGLNIQNIVNYYLVYPDGLGATLTGYARNTWPAIADADSILTYSYQPLVVALQNLQGKTTASNSPYDPNTLNVFEKQLYEWYWKNPDFLSGTLQIRGDPAPRVGQRIEAGWWPFEAYIESVQHDIVVLQSYTTTLRISRGTKPGTQYPGSSFTPFYQAKDQSGSTNSEGDPLPPPPSGGGGTSAPSGGGGTRTWRTP